MSSTTQGTQQRMRANAAHWLACAFAIQALGCNDTALDADPLLQNDASVHADAVRDGLLFATGVEDVEQSSSLPAVAAARDEAGPVAVSRQALTPCTGLQLTRWPVDGINGQTWLIHNYTDRITAAGTVADYRGQSGALARTYDGHNGADVMIASFREMDNNSALARAAAPGTVVRVVQNLPDRETTLPAGCSRVPNYVEVDHGNGYHGFYLHIKRNSARVSVGASVAAGTALAVIGSSGCSSAPHLHFELQCGGAVLEPFGPNLWSLPPVYRPTSQVIDTMVRAGAGPNLDQIKDPGPDAQLLQPASVLGLGIVLGASQGDVLHARVKRPNGTTFVATDWTVPGNARYGGVYAAFQWTIGADSGSWSVEAQVNSGRIVSKRFTVP